MPGPAVNVLIKLLNALIHLQKSGLGNLIVFSSDASVKLIYIDASLLLVS